jgi:hypothetical protein
VRDNIGFTVKPDSGSPARAARARVADGRFVSAYVLRSATGINQDLTRSTAICRPLPQLSIGQVQRDGYKRWLRPRNG